ncbi:unnamed protein product [Cyclocybe aegerita]|uniref:Protein kinase domain-containing protein n=1 Tax=Cyclocybe aegerita TaxID=1973307 RepID=A0A8S0W823_CYCAE|nr:unnamed protein product [Cyclocybe aegerita]
MSAQPPPRSMSMFDLTNANTLIAGGAFTMVVNHPVAEPTPNQAIDTAFNRHVEHRATHDSYDHAGPEPPRCHPKTRVRLLKDLRKWIQDASPQSTRITWVSGSVGVGKTAVARTLAESLPQSGMLAASFMLDDKRYGEHPVLSTIAYQIIMSTPDVQPHVLDALQADSSLLDKPPEVHFAKLVVEPFVMLSLIEKGQTSQWCRLVMIDGLDVSRHPTRILRAICDAIAKLDGRFKFLILSRPGHDIKNFFEHDAQALKLMPKHIALDDHPDANKDIRTFIEARFREIRRKHPLGRHIKAASIPFTSTTEVQSPTQVDSEWPGKYVLRTLVHRSSRGFIYPSVAMDYIGAGHAWPKDRLDIVLGVSPPSSSNEGQSEANSPFATLDDLYHKILSAAYACACPGPSAILAHQTLCSTDRRKALMSILGVLLAARTRAALPSPVKVPDRDPYVTPTFIERVLGMREGQVRLSLKDLRALVCLEEGVNFLASTHVPANARNIAATYPTLRIMHESPFSEFLLDRNRARQLSVDLDRACVAIAASAPSIASFHIVLTVVIRCGCKMDFTCEHSIDCEMIHRTGFFWASYNTPPDPFLLDSVMKFDPTYVFHRQPGDPEFKDWIFHWDWVGPFLQCLDSAPAFKDTLAFSHHLNKLCVFLQTYIMENLNTDDARFRDARTLLAGLKCLSRGRARGQVARINAEVSKCVWDALHGTLRGLRPLSTSSKSSDPKEPEKTMLGGDESKSSGYARSGGGRVVQFETPWMIMRDAMKEVIRRLDTHSKEDISREEVGGEDAADSDVFMRTPTKANATNRPNASVSETRKALKIELAGYLYSPIPVETFTHHVWGLDNTTITSILEKSWSILPEALNNYQDVYQNITKREEEPPLHEPFREISERLLEDICKFLGRKPDLLRGWKPLNDLRWDETKSTLEFKLTAARIQAAVSRSTANQSQMMKSKKKAKTNASRLDPIFEDDAGPSHDDDVFSHPQTASCPGAISLSKVSGSRQSATSAGVPSASTSTGSKRAIDAIDTPNEEPASKRCHLKVTGDQLQFANYALECLVWYYDRGAVIRTDKFDFSKPDGPPKLAVGLFTLSQANMKQAGFDPFVHEFKTPEDGKNLDDKSKDIIFVITKVLHVYKAIIGRGTYVAAGFLASIGSLLSMPRLPAYWNSHLLELVFDAQFTSEQLGIPRQKLRDNGLLKDPDPEDTIQDRGLHILVSGLYKKLYEAASVEEFKQIFLEYLECHHHAYETGRVLHRDISENNLMFARSRTEKASSSPSPDSMSTKPNVRGILNDFDLGSELNEHGEIVSSNANHRTGTPSFMATDLIKVQIEGSPIPATHHYRYDLESFFYVLIWACTQYTLSPDGPKLKPTPKCLQKWNDLQEASNHKGAFFFYDQVVHVEKTVLPHFVSVWNDWVLPLYDMFLAAFKSIPSIRSLKYVEYDHATCNGQITFKTFVEAMGVKRRNLEGIIEE